MPSLEKLEVGGLTFKDFTNFWVREFEMGPETVETNDLDNPAYDDTYLGVDFHRAPTWTFELVIEGKTEGEVLDNLDRVKAVWRKPAYTKKAGTPVELYYTIAGRRRLVYGRPRRFAVSNIQTAQQGYLTVLAEFKLSDPLNYEGTWITNRLESVPPDTRGLEEYLTEDTLTTEVGGARDGQLGKIEGTAPTPFKVTIYGPMTNPGFTIAGRRYQFNMTLAAGQRLEIDSRLGTVRRNGTTNMIHTMQSPTPIKNIRLTPGRAVEVSFFGVDPTLTAYAVFAYRPARY